jgi:tetratricopeptide (TPR) repeat protein
MSRKTLKTCLIGALLISFSMTAGCGPAPGNKRNNSPAIASGKDSQADKPARFDSRTDDLRPENRVRAELMFYIMVGEIAGQRKRYDIAAKSYLKAAMLSSDPEIAKRATRIAVYARDLVTARKAASRWSQLQPRSTGPHRFLVALYIRMKNAPAAIRHLKQIVRLSPSQDEGFDQIARILAREKDKTMVMKVMAGLMKSYHRNAFAQFTYARLAVRFQEYALAEKLLVRTLKLRPDWVRARTVYAAVLMKLGKAGPALVEMKKLVRAKPESRKLRLAYARLLAEARRYRESRAQFERLLKKNPRDASLLYGAALLGIESKQYRVAKRYLKRLLKTRQLAGTAEYYLGVVAEQRKRYAEAIRWYKRVDRGERVTEAKIRIAIVMSKRGEVEAARKQIYRIPARTNRMRVRLMMVEAEILKEAGRRQDAMSVLDHALKKFPGHKDLLYARAMLAEKMDRLDILERDLRAILKREPNNVHALNALGYTLADRTSRVNEALSYIRKAYRLSPNEPAVIDSMGWVYYRLNQKRKALGYLRRAYQLERDPEIAAHLGEVLWQNGNRSEARRVWNKALKDDPDNQILQKTMKRFLK